MKANPGGTVKGSAIIGREAEIADLWRKIETRSVVLSSERRVGKTSVLRKMSERPQDGWTPVLTLVESVRHPIDCVSAVYAEADRLQVRSSKRVWAGRVRSAYETIAGGQFGSFKLPQLRSDWKLLLRALVEDIVDNTSNRILIMLDEFPLMIWNVADDHGGAVAMEFLDTLREMRQRFESTDKIRFIFAGSIGFHLVLQHLKSAHGYKGSPTNDMALMVLTGLTLPDTELMCRAYLDDEGITRSGPVDIRDRMFSSTDGLPLYIQYVCEKVQESRVTEIRPDDIDRILREMLDSREIEWFRNAAQRIDTYYAKFHLDVHAYAVLKTLSHSVDFVAEPGIIDYVKSQMVVETNKSVLDTLELLLDDNYIIRDTSTGHRRYRFRYVLMKTWWQINRG